MKPDLTDLRNAMRAEGAPARIEHQIMAAFREHHHRRGRSARIGWLVAAGAAAACIWLFSFVRQKPADPPAPVIARMQPAPVLTARTLRPQVRRAPARGSRRPAKTIPVKTAPRSREEFATDFLELPYAPPLADGAPAQVIRVRLPRTAMRSVGLPFDEHRAFERVPADVLLGEDGLARAVRFVKVAR